MALRLVRNLRVNDCIRQNFQNDLGLVDIYVVRGIEPVAAAAPDDPPSAILTLVGILETLDPEDEEEVSEPEGEELSCTCKLFLDDLVEMVLPNTGPRADTGPSDSRSSRRIWRGQRAHDGGASTVGCLPRTAAVRPTPTARATHASISRPHPIGSVPSITHAAGIVGWAPPSPSTTRRRTALMTDDEIVAAYRARTHTVLALRAASGLSLDRLYVVLAAAGVPRRNHFRDPSLEERNAQIMERLSAGASQAQVAREHGLTRARISQMVREWLATQTPAVPEATHDR